MSVDPLDGAMHPLMVSEIERRGVRAPPPVNTFCQYSFRALYLGMKRNGIAYNGGCDRWLEQDGLAAGVRVKYQDTSINFMASSAGGNFDTFIYTFIDRA